METPPPLAGLDPADLLRQGAEDDTIVDGLSSAFQPLAMEEIAAAFPQFEILELIGQGGMGAVYKVRQKDLDRTVALKILPPAIGQSPEFSERFTREARALAKLNHPGIVTIHEFGLQDGLYFILMEFVDGVNLAQLMKTGRVSPREALAIVPQICDALQYAHDQGIVHRDIKPENLLLDRQGRVKVADFGIAKVVAAVCDRRTNEDDNQRLSQSDATLAGKIIGTPQYMAPEQIEHPSEVDHRADIYALGVVFYQMLTGELPGKDLQAPSRKVHIDVRLDEIVLKAMEKNPEQRYQHASVMRTRVDGLRNPGHVQSPPQTKSGSGSMRRWWWVFLVMLPVGLLIGMVAGWAWASMAPKKYEARAVVETRPTVVGLGPSFLMDQVQVINSRRVLNNVVLELKLQEKWGGEDKALGLLKEMIFVENTRGTDLLSLIVRHTNPHEAADICNSLARSYAGVHKTYNRPAVEVVVHDQAVPPTVPVSPNKGPALIAGAIAGLILSPLLAFTLIRMVLRAEKQSPSDQAQPHYKSPVTRSGSVWFMVAAACLVAGSLWLVLRDGGKSYPASSFSSASAAVMLRAYDWNDLAASGQAAGGVLVTEDGQTCLKIENPNDSALSTRLLTIDTPPLKAKRYAVMGEIRYANVKGPAYLEMWSVFPNGRFFSRTLGDPGSGPMGQLTGTSGWREFSLPFDSTGTKDAPTRIEVNLHLPGSGVVFVGPLRLVEFGTDKAAGDSAEPRMPPVEVDATALSITVSGEVRKAGTVRLNAPASLLDAFAAAGGWTENADLAGIRLRIPGEPEAQIIDLTAILWGDAVNPLVPPGAIVEIRAKRKP